MLTLQGVGWFTRKAIGLATVTLDIEQYQAPPEGSPDTDAPVTHVDVKQTATGGIKGMILSNVVSAHDLDCPLH